MGLQHWVLKDPCFFYFYAGAGNRTLKVSIQAGHSNHWPTGLQCLLVLKFPDLVKHLMNVFLHAAALFGILFNYRGKAYRILNSLRAPSLTFSTNYSWLRKPIACCCPLSYFVQLQGKWCCSHYMLIRFSGNSLFSGLFVLVNKWSVFSSKLLALTILYN